MFRMLSICSGVQNRNHRRDDKFRHNVTGVGALPPIFYRTTLRVFELRNE